MPIIAVSCPKCHSRHELPPSAAPMPPDGIRLECACGAAFRVRPSAVARAATLADRGDGGRTLSGLGPGPLGGVLHAAEPSGAAPGGRFELDPSIMDVLAPRGAAAEEPPRGLPGMTAAPRGGPVIPGLRPPGPLAASTPAGRQAGPLVQPRAAALEEPPQFDDDLLEPIGSGLDALPAAPTRVVARAEAADPFSSPTRVGDSMMEIGLDVGPTFDEFEAAPGGAVPAPLSAGFDLDGVTPPDGTLDLGLDLDLPTPSGAASSRAGLGSAHGGGADLDFGLDLADPGIDLPTPAVDLPTPAIALPTPAVGLPTPAAALPTPAVAASRPPKPLPPSLEEPDEGALDLGLDLSPPAGTGMDGVALELGFPGGAPLAARATGSPFGAPERISADQTPPRHEGSGEFSLDFLTNPVTAAAAAVPPPPRQAGAPAPVDLGFDLPPEPAPRAAPTESAAAPLRTPGSQVEGLPALAPPRPKLTLKPRQALTPQPVTVAPPARSKRRLGLALAGALTLAGGGLAALLFAGGGTDPSALLGASGADLARDEYLAYARAAGTLTASGADGASGERLGAAAAELTLLGALGHGGGKPEVMRAEELLAAVSSSVDGEPVVRRARALLAIAKNKGGEVDKLLGGAATPEDELVRGLRYLLDGKHDKAASALQKASAGAPERLLPAYLLARAREATNPAQALEGFRQVAAKNPKHWGARIGLLRLSKEAPEKRLAAARTLAAEIGSSAAPGEQAEVQVLIGRNAAALGQSEEALAALTRATALHPANANAATALAEALLDSGRYGEALERLRTLGPIALRTPAGRFAMGGALIGSGAVDEGLKTTASAAADAPKDPRGPYWTGVATELGKLGDAAAAERSYRAALALEDDFLPAALRLAALLQRTGEVEEAMAVLRQAEEAGAPAAALQLAWGDALLAAGKVPEATNVFQQAVGQHPRLPAAHVGLASALEAAGDAKKAQETLDKAIATLPDALGLRERMADLLIRAGKPTEALAQLEADVKRGKAPAPTRVKLANLAIDLGQITAAERELEAVIGATPDAPGALFALGRLREAQGQLSLAIQEYRRALGFERSPALHMALGRAYLRAGKDDEAAGAFEAAGELADARIERGRIRLRKADLERALVDFQDAARLAPKDPEPLTLQGVCLDQLGQTDRAAELWARALALAPGAAEAHYRIGRLKMDRGKATEALAHLRAAASRVPPKSNWEADLYFQLGYAELAAGSRAQGADALKRYLAVAPADTPARPEVERQIARLKRN